MNGCRCLFIRDLSFDSLDYIPTRRDQSPTVSVMTLCASLGAHLLIGATQLSHHTLTCYCNPQTICDRRREAPADHANRYDFERRTDVGGHLERAATVSWSDLQAGTGSWLAVVFKRILTERGRRPAVTATSRSKLLQQADSISCNTCRIIVVGSFELR